MGALAILSGLTVGVGALVSTILGRGSEGGRSKDGPDDPGALPEPGRSGGKFLKAIAVGNRSQVGHLLDEMRTHFAQNGVDLSVITLEEVTRLWKVKGTVFAIPDRRYWPNMVRTILLGFMPIRRTMDVPLSVRGYRPSDYNRAVKGAPNSRHQSFEGLDIYVAGGNRGDRRRLGHVTAELYAATPRDLKMGIGIYGFPVPSNSHIDFGHRRRTWREAKKYLANVA